MNGTIDAAALTDGMVHKQFCNMECRRAALTCSLCRGFLSEFQCRGEWLVSVSHRVHVARMRELRVSPVAVLLVDVLY